MKVRRMLAPLLSAALAAAGLGTGDARADESIAVANFGHMHTRGPDGPDGKPLVLPLRHTRVSAEVVGVMSAVTVQQYFHNPLRRPIEAVYVFPLPHRAAVHAMTIRLAGRQIRAVIRERQKARKEYEQARAAGKTAALLEQERPNIFTQSVANILPGELVEVELRYVEELLPEEGEYQFVFPMVVGPRYVGGGQPLAGWTPPAAPARALPAAPAAGESPLVEAGAAAELRELGPAFPPPSAPPPPAPRTPSGTGWGVDTTRIPDAARITPPLLPPGMRPGHDIALSLRLHTGLPIQSLVTPQHRVKVRRHAPDVVDVFLAPGSTLPNRDFVLRYGLAGARPESVAVASQDGRGGHLMLMIQPPARMRQADAVPLEYVFVIDTSGSQQGFPLDLAKRVMHQSLHHLRAHDRFQMIRFSQTAHALAGAALEPTWQNLARGRAFIDGLLADGGTEYLPPLKLAFEAPPDPLRARVVVFITDGFIGYDAKTLRFVRENRGRATVFSVGTGTSVNRFLIDGLATIGGGEPFVVVHESELDREVKKIFRAISRPALTDIQIDWRGLPVSDVTPAQPRDLFADRPVLVSARYHAPRSLQGWITVRARVGGRPYLRHLPVFLPGRELAIPSSPVAFLWARRQIDEWMQRHQTEPEHVEAAQKKVTDLALGYSLLSQFTSFVAIDERVRYVKKPGSPERIAVPVPLPRGTGLSAAPPEAFVAARVQSDRVSPGDPELSVLAPRDAVAVTAVLPGGEVKVCRKDPYTGRWLASFVVHGAAQPGLKAIHVVVTLASGQQLRGVVRFQVKGTAPEVRVTLSRSTVKAGEEVTLVVETATPGGHVPARADDVGDPGFAARVHDDVAGVTALLPGGEVRTLEARRAGRDDPLRFVTRFKAPTTPGRHEVVVVARDQARNKVRKTIWLIVE